MTELRTFQYAEDWASSPQLVSSILEAVNTNGAAIVRDVIDQAFLDELTAELRPWVEGTPGGRDGFTGFQTSRTGALVARSPKSRELVMHPLVLDLANGFLAPFTNRIQLHLTQVIRIMPGQGSQPLHRDRLAWGGYIPRQIEPQFNTIWALTDFTEDNGATRVVPGSPAWDDDRRARPEEKTQAVMTAGSVLLYSGSVVHGGGENRSDTDRWGVNLTYTLSWLRTEENQYLSCPPDIARELDPDLQELMGYTMGNYALGYYSDPKQVLAASDTLPPELAVGRKPRRQADMIGLLTAEDLIAQDD
ncbi:MAG: phytanoyl-CoA dioxygenase family protein [Actinomycetota bacterium]|nr:phytanoyl-CoA dioxygenase family protein [Actinomycetota bacterium]